MYFNYCFQSHEVFQLHYNLLSELGIYVKELKTSGKIASIKSEGNTRERINRFEKKLYQFMCSLKITLHTTKYDVTDNVNVDILDPDFIAAKLTLENSVFRAYVTMEDSIKLMDFFIDQYNKME